MSISIRYPIRTCGAADLTHRVNRIAAGDHQALAQLYEQTRRLIYGVVVRILQHAEDAEEVVLDVYVQVWNQSISFDPARGSVEAWLCMIARTRALDRLRARAARPDLDQTNLPVDALTGDYWLDELAVSQEARWLVGAALQALTPAERHLVNLAFYDGYTHREISGLMDAPLGTVKTRIRMCLQKMRRVLAPSVSLAKAAA
jgi:RNA polymerase sigma-70 factor (ECF subfamily)